VPLMDVLASPGEEQVSSGNIIEIFKLCQAERDGNRGHTVIMG
jgi:hypothetical protein